MRHWVIMLVELCVAWPANWCVGPRFYTFWVEKHTHVGAVDSLESLARRALAILQDVSLDDATLERMGLSDATLAAKGWARPITWLALVALLEFNDEGLAAGALPAIAKIHERLVARGTAHLELVVHNVMHTSWLAGAVPH